jgi:hypothetical protein
MNKAYKDKLRKELSAYNVHFVDRLTFGENFLMYLYHKNYRKADYYHGLGGVAEVY